MTSILYPRTSFSQELQTAKGSAFSNSNLHSRNNNDKLNATKIKSLVKEGFTRGLAKSLNDTKSAFGERIWIVDNSGSMQNRDGHRIQAKSSNSAIRFMPCTRWEEIQDCVRYHIRMSGLIEAPTTFRLLNEPTYHYDQEFSITNTIPSDEGEFGPSVQRGLRTIDNVYPIGGTPLTRHMREIYEKVSGMTPQLRAHGQRAVIVIATDGLPSDSNGHSTPLEKDKFVNSLRLLEGLPVWVVIRLCTDDDNVVDFYNDLDSCLELSIEVLDDFTAEAKEVYECNPWLTYGLPLHRMREMGYHDRVFDMLDERLLTKSELRDFMALLFGEDNMDFVPDPSLNWNEFVAQVECLLSREAYTWNPLKLKMKPWISIKKLNHAYKHSGPFGIAGRFFSIKE